MSLSITLLPEKYSTYGKGPVAGWIVGGGGAKVVGLVEETVELGGTLVLVVMIVERFVEAVDVSLADEVDGDAVEDDATGLLDKVVDEVTLLKEEKDGDAVEDDATGLLDKVVDEVTLLKEEKDEETGLEDNVAFEVIIPEDRNDQDDVIGDPDGGLVVASVVEYTRVHGDVMEGDGTPVVVFSVMVVEAAKVGEENALLRVLLLGEVLDVRFVLGNADDVSLDAKIEALVVSEEPEDRLLSEGVEVGLEVLVVKLLSAVFVDDIPGMVEFTEVGTSVLGSDEGLELAGVIMEVRVPVEELLATVIVDDLLELVELIEGGTSV